MSHKNDSWPPVEISHGPELPVKLGNKLVFVIIRQANWAQVCAKGTFNYVSNTHIRYMIYHIINYDVMNDDVITYEICKIGFIIQGTEISRLSTYR